VVAEQHVAVRRGGLGRLVFGSVADAVLRQSGVPVLLVRAKLGEG